jgi:hypothetical protein
MPFDLALLRALLAALFASGAAARLVQALPAPGTRLLDQALALASAPVAAKVPHRRA